jgi:hypothetical protein
MKGTLRLTSVITGTIALAAALSAAAPADAQEAPLLTFHGGIGADPVANIGTANVVRGVSPGGLIWVIRDLVGRVDTAGHISVLGVGLLLGAGDVIGTNGGQSVYATLFCGPAASATASSSTATGVPLDSSGDFVINDVLTPVPANPCVDPVLLIRSATVASHPWFAAGIGN